MKQPFCFEVNDGELFAFAGIWDRWKDPSGQWIKSCSILTTTPNTISSAVHDRMPVILAPDDYVLWLDPGMTNVGAISDLLAIRLTTFATVSVKEHLQCARSFLRLYKREREIKNALCLLMLLR